MGKLTQCTAACLLLLTVLSTRTWAQARGGPNLGIGYSFLREIGASAPTYPTGWAVDLATAPAPVSWVGEIAANYRMPGGVRQTLSSYQGGVRLTPMTGHLTGFVQLLAGLERYAEAGFHQQGLAVQPGGGLEFPVSERYSVRGQVDCRLVRIGASSRLPATTFKELRVVIGIAIGLGR